MNYVTRTLAFAIGFLSCSEGRPEAIDMLSSGNEFLRQTAGKLTFPKLYLPAHVINVRFHIKTGKTRPAELLAFAHTLLGTPYKYASINPSVGFDCSGFITYVFNHFDIRVPRTSVEFTYVGRELSLRDAKPGDIILFTGTNSKKRIVGHMGIITSNRNRQLKFIHSSSGKANGVTISLLSKHYRLRLMKIIRVFKKMDRKRK